MKRNTSSVLALDPDNGQLKWYHQEIPHDDWDYDAGLGESLVLDRDGKKLLVHQNKSGFVFVYDRTNGKIQNVWPMNHVYNWVQRIDPKTGELIGRNPPRLGKPHFICPWIAGGRSWNSGSYNPKTGLWYNTAMEVCEDVTVEKQTPVTEPATDDMLTIEPARAAIIPGRKARIMWNIEVTLTSNAAFHCSSGTVSTLPAGTMPAQLKITSALPMDFANVAIARASRTSSTCGSQPTTA